MFTDKLSILSQPYSVIRIIVANRTASHRKKLNIHADSQKLVKPNSGIARGELRSTLSRAGSCRCPAIINHSVSGNFRHITDIISTKNLRIVNKRFKNRIKHLKNVKIFINGRKSFTFRKNFAYYCSLD